MGQIEPKPCPNPDCEGKPEDIETDGTHWAGGQSLYLACEGCGTRGPWCDTEEEATVAWNRLPRVGNRYQPATAKDHAYTATALHLKYPDWKTCGSASLDNILMGIEKFKEEQEKTILEPAVVDDDSLVAMHQQYDDEKWDAVHKRINGYGKKSEPNDRPTQPNTAPVDKDRFPHICTLCDAPAYLAGEGGYSECSNPGCELS